MKIREKIKNKNSSLISSILFFIIGAILLAKSEEVFEVITKAIGIFLLIYTIINVITYIINLKKGNRLISKILISIVSITFAIIFIFFNEIIYATFNFIIGGWILFAGINRLIKGITTKRIPLLILSSIITILGVYIILNGTYLFLRTIGIIMMVYATIEIIEYIMYGKNEQPINEEKTLEIDDNSQLIIPENTDKKKMKKEPKIKDVDIKE